MEVDAGMITLVVNTVFMLTVGIIGYFLKDIHNDMKETKLRLDSIDKHVHGEQIKLKAKIESLEHRVDKLES